MKQAVDLAVENVRSGRGGPFAAIVVRGGGVLACGANLVTSTKDPTAHAEIIAIRAACREMGSFQLAGCDIYTTCEPCPMCMGAIYWARLDHVYFSATRIDAAQNGFDDAYIYGQLRLAPHMRAIPATQVLGEEAVRPFAEWQARPDRVKY